ncbi:bifunctional heptose 7-phosphate kinase/heptose 1-phosphate adenyltransferase [Fulvivirga lutimaris]|uniref:bifunctional heptose 7-phosphate kinase/heptose 1-phosphate adenyltransferase n=1 Tax=Fulvivirga lutimaris TaxID=1819566 RepID=UPI0012BC0199|nr:bifunctional ADP-heptose synthase [Fulvivirga lutimaris]MTI39703.1 D-glycero-beta-D-manno-heptose-7-phosphate kinase [Fulvivirga lutimaris]
MSYSNFNQIFNAFEGLNVLIIGDVMIDAYIWGAVERISPEAPVPIVRATKRDYRLGGAANVALNVQALGANPILCAVIGDDEGSTKFKERLEINGISDKGIVESSERPTTVKTRVLSGHHHMVRVDEETDRILSKSEESQLLKRIELLLSDSQVVIFEDYDKGVITKNVIKKTVEMAKAKNIPTVVDPKKRNFLAYKGTTLFKPNLKELKEGLKLDFEKDNQVEIEKAVELLIEKLGSEGSLITLSERGVFIHFKNEKHQIPAHLREIADVSGAGDTVISIAALCIALNLSPKIIAALSNLGGGLVCEHIGVVPIDKNDLLQEANKLNIPL